MSKQQQRCQSHHLLHLISHSRGQILSVSCHKLLISHNMWHKFSELPQDFLKTSKNYLDFNHRATKTAIKFSLCTPTLFFGTTHAVFVLEAQEKLLGESVAHFVKTPLSSLRVQGQLLQICASATVTKITKTNKALGMHLCFQVYTWCLAASPNVEQTKSWGELASCRGQPSRPWAKPFKHKHIWSPMNLLCFS